eukprot:4838385-Prymnesium_polylepis.1
MTLPAVQPPRQLMELTSNGAATLCRSMPCTGLVTLHSVSAPAKAIVLRRMGGKMLDWSYAAHELEPA